MKFDTEPFWRTLHSHFVDAMTWQLPETQEAMLQRVGVTYSAFLQAFIDGRLRSIAVLDDAARPCFSIEVQAQPGDWHRLVAVPVVCTGEDPELIRGVIEDTWHAYMDAAGIVDPFGDQS